MSDASETIRAAAEQAGLQRALQKFPEGVKAGYERGARPLGAAPKGTPALIHPAPVFDPVRSEKHK